MSRLSRNEQAVRFVVEHTRSGRTRLMKLLYLADLEARKCLGRPITSFDWTWFTYGPYTTEVNAAQDKLEEEGYIERGPSMFDELTLDAAEVHILNSVISRFGGLSATQLKELSYGTEPMLEARRHASEGTGQRLEMSVVDNQTRASLGGLDLLRVVEAWEESEEEPGIPFDTLRDRV